MTAPAAAGFAKQLHTALIYTVGDFTDATLTQLGPDRLSYSCTAALDEYLQQFPGLPENRHAALGTAVPTWLLRVVGATALAHLRCGVVLLWPPARMLCDALCHV